MLSSRAGSNRLAAAQARSTAQRHRDLQPQRSGSAIPTGPSRYSATGGPLRVETSPGPGCSLLAVARQTVRRPCIERPERSSRPLPLAADLVSPLLSLPLILVGTTSRPEPPRLSTARRTRSRRHGSRIGPSRHSRYPEHRQLELHFEQRVLEARHVPLVPVHCWDPRQSRRPCSPPSSGSRSAPRPSTAPRTQQRQRQLLSILLAWLPFRESATVTLGSRSKVLHRHVYNRLQTGSTSTCQAPTRLRHTHYLLRGSAKHRLSLEGVPCPTEHRRAR